MKVAVIGGSGQLGRDIIAEFKKVNEEVYGLSHCDVEIYDIDSILNLIKSLKPDLLINTAAYHNVEKCEENPLRAFQVNAIGTRNIAIACAEKDVYFMHISTDYVFDGKSKLPYLESDKPAPLNVYATSKLAGEHFVESIASKYVILRTSGLYGSNPCRAKGGLNFVKLMLKLATEKGKVRVVDNEVLTPTYTVELARQIVALRYPDFYGLAHATAECYCSWYQFAKMIFEISKVNVDLQVADPNEFPSKVVRPEYSVLENNVLKQYGKNIFRHWEEGLAEYLQQS